jgi:3'-5' exoribonuclease
VQAEKKGPPPELMTPVIYVPRQGGGQRQGEPRKNKEKRRPEPRAPQPAGDAKPAEGPVEVAPEGAAREARPERPPRPDRPDRGGPRGFGGGGGFGDKKRGYQGPRLPGDKGPHSRPPESKKLTHNPFAALAQKLEGAGEKKPEEAEAPAAHAEPAPEAAPPATEQAAPSETAAPTEAPAVESKPGEGT